MAGPSVVEPEGIVAGGKPLGGKGAAHGALFAEPGAAEGPVQQGRAFGEGWVLNVHQVVPAALDGTDFMITAEPVKAVQVEPGCCVDVLRGERGATAAVEQHQ